MELRKVEDSGNSGHAADELPRRYPLLREQWEQRKPTGRNRAQTRREVVQRKVSLSAVFPLWPLVPTPKSCNVC